MKFLQDRDEFHPGERRLTAEEVNQLGPGPQDWSAWLRTEFQNRPHITDNSDDILEELFEFERETRGRIANEDTEKI